VNIEGFALTNGAHIDLDWRSFAVLPEEKVTMFTFRGAQNFFGTYEIANVNLPSGGVDLEIIVNPNDAILHIKCRLGNCPPSPTMEPSAVIINPAVPTPRRSEAGGVTVPVVLLLALAFLHVLLGGAYTL
jgi:hypothetical protein